MLFSMKLNSVPPKNAGLLSQWSASQYQNFPKVRNGSGKLNATGYRAIAVKTQNDVTLFPRRRKFLNRQIPNVVEALADLPASTVVDGRIARHRRKGSRISICCRISAAQHSDSISRLRPTKFEGS
jgi:hypothetical protein